MALKYTPVTLFYMSWALNMINYQLFKVIKNLKFHSNAMDVCLIGLKEWKYVKIYFEYMGKVSKKVLFISSCFLLLPTNFKLTIVCDNNLDNAIWRTENDIWKTTILTVCILLLLLVVSLVEVDVVWNGDYVDADTADTMMQILLFISFFDGKQYLHHGTSHLTLCILFIGQVCWLCSLTFASTSPCWFATFCRQGYQTFVPLPHKDMH